MFDKYLATPTDFKAVTEALGFVMNPKMEFVFEDKSKIANTVIVSYDSKFIYIWKLKPIKLKYQIPHNLKIPDEWQSGWWATLILDDIAKLIPDLKDKPVINGGLLTPFIELQKRKDIKENPYVTKESYFATIIHELGHIYWNSFKLWWPSNKKENILTLKEAEKLFKTPKMITEKVIQFPSPLYLGEVFASCAEYYASSIFWPSHKENFDNFAKIKIKTILEFEKVKNLNTDDSVIEPTKYQHTYALVATKLLISKYPNTWPGILTKHQALA